LEMNMVDGQPGSAPAAPDSGQERTNAATRAYEEALARVATLPLASIQTVVLDVVVARQRLAQRIRAAPPNSTSLARIVELDATLRDKAREIDSAIGSHQLEAWRDSTRPEAGEWWWSLDAVAVHQCGPGVPWGLVTAIFFTISLTLAADTSVRLVSDGPDLLGLLGTTLQGLLAALAGSTFTQTGRQWIEACLARLGVRRARSGLWLAGLALTVLVGLGSLRLSFPRIAAWDNVKGVELQGKGQLTGALAHLRRSIRLSPDHATAHYNLGSTYESLLAYDKAATEYMLALEVNDRLYAAYNNLARLQLLHGEPTSALALLQREERVRVPPGRARYAFFKNRGWAYLAIGDLEQAETDLRRAKAEWKDGAAAHCLLAQVLEARGAKDSALTEWEPCLAFLSGQEDRVEPLWQDLAQRRLRIGGPR
jgi:tetratricopeptide (TPR) repeat protein